MHPSKDPRFVVTLPGHELTLKAHDQTNAKLWVKHLNEAAVRVQRAVGILSAPPN